MLKNKFKTIAILVIVIIALTLPIVRAENVTIDSTYVDNSTPTDTIAPISEEPVDITSDSPDASDTSDTSDDNYVKNDIYLTGDDVVIDYIIDGNLFVLADTVTINSQIGGDAFICANNITVGEQGYVFSNLFAISKDITINGVIYDLYAASNNTTINGYVYRDIKLSSNNVNIFGTIGRNAFINCDSLNFVKDSNDNDDGTQDPSVLGVISGNLNYSSKQEASIPDGIITGEVVYNKEGINSDNIISNIISSLITFVVIVCAIWLICIWLTPKFIQNSSSLLTKKFLPVVGLSGILTPIVLVLLVFLLFASGITFTLGLLTLLILIILIVVSTSIFIISINNIICNKLNITKKISIFGMLIVSCIVLWLIGLIPFVGTIVSIIAIILGLGIIVSNLILKNKEIKD